MKLDAAAQYALEEARKELRIARAQLRIVKALARVKPHLRAAVIDLAADRAESLCPGRK